MSSKNKKSNHKKKNEDLSDKKEEKKVGFKDSDINDNSKTESDNSLKKSDMRKRKHTKVSHKSKENKFKNEIIDDDQDGNGRKVKFGKIDVIDVESWKKLNLKLTAEENIDELIKLSEGKKERIKNVSCSCIII